MSQGHVHVNLISLMGHRLNIICPPCEIEAINQLRGRKTNHAVKCLTIIGTHSPSRDQGTLSIAGTKRPPRISLVARRVLGYFSSKLTVKLLEPACGLCGESTKFCTVLVRRKQIFNQQPGFIQDYSLIDKNSYFWINNTKRVSLYNFSTETGGLCVPRDSLRIN